MGDFGTKNLIFAKFLNGSPFGAEFVSNGVFFEKVFSALIMVFFVKTS